MKIIFFEGRTRFIGGEVEQKWARIILKDAPYCESCKAIDKDDFKAVRVLNNNYLKIKNIEVLEPDDTNIYSAGDDAINAIEEVLQEEKVNPQVIFSMDFARFSSIVKETEHTEFEPKLIATEERNMLFYGMYGEDDSILMVSYFEQY